MGKPFPNKKCCHGQEDISQTDLLMTFHLLREVESLGMGIIPGDVSEFGKFIRPKEGKPRCFREKTLYFSKVLLIHLGCLHLITSAKTSRYFEKEWKGNLRPDSYSGYQKLSFEPSTTSLRVR